MTGLIKICGIREHEHAEAAAAAGADFIGFVFAESRRRVTPAEACQLIATARTTNPAIRAVGLFVNASSDEIRRVRDTAGFDLVQLHGERTTERLSELGVPAIVSLRVEPEADPLQLHRFAEDVARYAELIMIDGYHPTLAGGTGLRADWNVAGRLALNVPVLLAGGLDPECVSEAIRTVQPAGVDVSGGVERNGIKDAELIRSFIANARAAFAQSISSGTSSQLAP